MDRTADIADCTADIASLIVVAAEVVNSVGAAFSNSIRAAIGTPVSPNPRYPSNHF